MGLLLLAVFAFAGEIKPGRVAIEWVRIPAGSFNMGSEEGSVDELPVHKVTLRSFELSRSEVTNKQYRACVKAGACTKPEADCAAPDFDGDRQPVVCVTWQQAVAFARWAGGRLPTEAEWEYATRSAGKRKHPWGEEEASCKRAVMYGGGYGCGKNTTWDVCSKPEGNTEQGVCDMIGNVWEWVQDAYHPTYQDAAADGRAWELKPGARVGRGGSWLSEKLEAQATYRADGEPTAVNRGLGFRVAR
jgi:formylglycine-generating enzyme required for sulfatase activity